MVNRNKRNIAVETDKLNAADHAVMLTQASEILSSQRNRNNKETSSNDELIGSLANAHENRRARQVTEWEQMRRIGFGQML